MTTENTVTFALSDDAKKIQATATRLGNGIANNSREVPGFIINAVRLIMNSGDTRPLLSFIGKLSDRDSALVVKLVGKLSGVTNKGKPRLVYKASEGRLEWTKDFRSGTLDEETLAVLSAAHGVKDFRDRSITKTLFPAKDKSDDAKLIDATKAFKAKVKAFAEAAAEADMDIGAIKAQMLAEVESQIAALRAPTAAAAA